MKTDSKSAKRRASLGNSIPGGEAQEMSDETGWVEWNQALEQSDRQFAPTGPMTAPMPPDGIDPRYAKTRPAALSTAKDISQAGRGKRLTAETAMVEARKNNRVCPKPRRWAELFGQMPQWAPEAADLPGAPLTGDAWKRTPALAKRMALRDHIEWAHKNGCLEPMLEFLKSLPEDEWHHMGD
ncbi:MAG TPA: hypothetical protein VHA82_23160 [Ramlibacter sp.]|uniref:hypothetical protein n=1 Tax=Ramlibacter sp. TaxID=1917967 RepID=UPI002C1E0B18|nr:hypothetical protein [Ramlibacter sp.]HVZ46725.1 hypothetical protein [Ramlibacter sp.]